MPRILPNDDSGCLRLPRCCVLRLARPINRQTTAGPLSRCPKLQLPSQVPLCSAALQCRCVRVGSAARRACMPFAASFCLLDLAIPRLRCTLFRWNLGGASRAGMHGPARDGRCPTGGSAPGGTAPGTRPACPRWWRWGTSTSRTSPRSRSTLRPGGGPLARSSEMASQGIPSSAAFPTGSWKTCIVPGEANAVLFDRHLLSGVGLGGF